MKRKTKLIAFVMSLCLVCAVFAIGVFALKTANLKIGGDVSFQATGVEADIKNATLSNTVADDGDGIVLATGSINTSMTQTNIDSTFQNWQSLELDFDADATDIELKFDIANTSTNADNYIEIDYSYSFSNANPNIDVFPGDENAQQAWENNNYILAPKGAAETATYETFTLKFKVLDDELNVPQGTKVSVNIELKHITPVGLAEGQEVTNSKMKATDGIVYTLNTDGTASLSDTDENCIGDNLDYDGNANLKIAPVVTDGENNYIVTTIGNYAFCDSDQEQGNLVIQSVAIPSSVTNIGDRVFANCTSLTSITIPESVTSIGDSVFYFCGSLTSITIPNSVASIGDGVFDGCTNLTSITIPYSVTDIGDEAFSGCTSLSSITIPNSVTSIGVGAFYSCERLEEIELPIGLESIPSSLFKATIITSITIPDGVKTIGASAFEDCTNLASIKIPKGVTTIDNDAFRNCTSLVSVVIPEGVTTINKNAFADCTSLVSISVPDSVTYIGGSAFNSCTALKSFIIPKGLAIIEGYTFYNCTSLTSFVIPLNVTHINNYAFNKCVNLVSVKVESPKNWWVTNQFDISYGSDLSFSETDFLENANILCKSYYKVYLKRKSA